MAIVVPQHQLTGMSRARQPWLRRLLALDGQNGRPCYGNIGHLNELVPQRGRVGRMIIRQLTGHLADLLDQRCQAQQVG